MAGDEEFDIFGSVVASELSQHLQHLAQQQVYQRTGHGHEPGGHAGV